MFVIAQVCLKEGEADDINRLLVKVGLRDMISALEYVYDLDFRHQQLEDFVLHAVLRSSADSLDERETVKLSYNDACKESDREVDDEDYERAVADREAARVKSGESVKSSSVVHGSIKARSLHNEDDSEDDEYRDYSEEDSNGSLASGHLGSSHEAVTILRTPLILRKSKSGHKNLILPMRWKWTMTVRE